MRLILLFLLTGSLAFAEAAADLRAALGRLGGKSAVRATVELRGTAGRGDAKAPAPGLPAVRGTLEDGPEGVRILWSRAVMDQALAEEAAESKNPEAKSPTRGTIDGMNASRAAGYLDATPEFLRMLEEATLVEAVAEPWEGREARRLTFKLTPHLNERNRKMIKELDATVKLWLGADGIPLAAERRLHAKGRALLVIGFETNEEESFRFEQCGDRLVVTHHQKSTTSTGAGETNHQISAAELTILR
jgi:hypothetical protein